MIYAVVPEALAPELYDKLVEYYRDDPHVEVIVDRRRRGEDRRATPVVVPGDVEGRRELRDRRRPPRAGVDDVPADAA